MVVVQRITAGPWSEYTPGSRLTLQTVRILHKWVVNGTKPGVCVFSWDNPCYCNMSPATICFDSSLGR